MEWNITADRPVYVQLMEQLEQAVAAGVLSPGQKLPGVRELAAEAAVNPNTMQRALQELESRGLLVTQRTAGRSVTEDADRVADTRRTLARQQARVFCEGMRRLGCSEKEMLELLQAAQEEEK